MLLPWCAYVSRKVKNKNLKSKVNVKVLTWRVACSGGCGHRGRLCIGDSCGRGRVGDRRRDNHLRAVLLALPPDRRRSRGRQNVAARPPRLPARVPGAPFLH